MRLASDRLLPHLRDRHDLAAVNLDLEPATPFPRADRYVLASALQKAIRRGHICTARRAGHQLLRLDRQRLWRRIAVTALEDVGIADIEVAALLVGIATLPAVRQVTGGDVRALDLALVRSCETVKDRAGDHLGSVVGRESASEVEKTALKMASLNALLAAVASSHLSWSYRARAVVLAAGRADGSLRSIAPDRGAVFDLMHELGVPLVLITACEVYAARQLDALPVLVPFAWLLRGGDSTTPRVVVRDVSAQKIGDMPSYALDPLWTRTGKRAIDLWLRSYSTRPAWLPGQVAAALWNAESALCDRILSWKLGDEIRERAHRADLLARGVPVERQAELSDWIERERPALHAARLAVWNSTKWDAPGADDSNLQANLPLPVTEPRKRHE